MIIDYDKLKIGSIVNVTFEGKPQQGTVKTIRFQPWGNLITVSIKDGWRSCTFIDKPNLATDLVVESY